VTKRKVIKLEELVEERNRREDNARFPFSGYGLQEYAIGSESGTLDTTE
jgi:hypothetical protein